MDCNPKVSIQIPTFNQQSILSKAIESCLSQTYQNIEINIADDCSSDATASVVTKYLNDTRVKYYKNTSNIGRVANYKKALFEYATGDWVINLDGDDFFINNFYIENAIKAIANSGNDILFYLGSMQYGSVTKNRFSFPNIATPLYETKAIDYYKNYFTYNHFAHFGFIIQRKYLIQEPITYLLDITSTDIVTVLNLCLKNKEKYIILSKEIAAFWLWNGSNFSQNINIAGLAKNYWTLIKFNCSSYKNTKISYILKWCFLFTLYTWPPFIKHSILKILTPTKYK